MANIRHKKLKALNLQNTERPHKSGTFSIKAFGAEIQVEGMVIWGVLILIALLGALCVSEMGS